MGLNSVDPQGLQENPLDVRKCVMHKENILMTVNKKKYIF